MTKVNASITTEKYKTVLSSDTNQLIVDEPAAKGGQDLGFSPFELLAGALASCTAITLRMYTDHKGWNTGKIEVEVDLEQDADGTAHFHRIVKLERSEGIDTNRIIGVANACPTHKLLSGKIEIRTDLG